MVSGNKQPEDSNIQDLISYIEYNNFSVVDSELYSVFDLLYQQYTAQRMEFLNKHKKISEYDSENLMFAALEDLLRAFIIIRMGLCRRKEINERIVFLRNIKFCCCGFQRMGVGRLKKLSDFYLGGRKSENWNK